MKLLSLIFALAGAAGANGFVSVLGPDLVVCDEELDVCRGRLNYESMTIPYFVHEWTYTFVRDLPDGFEGWDLSEYVVAPEVRVNLLDEEATACSVEVGTETCQTCTVCELGAFVTPPGADPLYESVTNLTVSADCTNLEEANGTLVSCASTLPFFYPLERPGGDPSTPAPSTSPTMPSNAPSGAPTLRTTGGEPSDDSSDPSSDDPSSDASSYGVEASILSTLVFEFFEDGPPSEEHVAGLIEATQAFFNDDLGKSNSPTSATSVDMMDIISTFEYGTSRFEMNFVAKVEHWCSSCGRSMPQNFDEDALSQMEDADYRRYIREYARKAEPEGRSAFELTRCVRFRGQVASWSTIKSRID